MGIVCLCADRQRGDQVARELADRLPDIGIDTDLMLWANDIEWCDLDSGEAGLQTDAARDSVAAITALSGLSQPLASREALASSLVGDRKSVAKVLPKAREAAALSSPRKEATWALDRLMKFHNDRLSLSDRDAARLLVAIESVPVRDRLWGDMNRATNPSHVALWTDLTRRAPEEVRAAPASLLALASWLSGDGTKALCAIDQVHHDQPYSLANLVSVAVQTGMHPREWESTRNITPVTGFAPERSTPRTAPDRSAPRL